MRPVLMKTCASSVTVRRTSNRSTASDVTEGVFFQLSNSFITEWGVVRSESCSEVSGHRGRCSSSSSFLQSERMLQPNSRGQ